MEDQVPMQGTPAKYVAEGDPTRLQWSVESGHAPAVITFKRNYDEIIAALQRVGGRDAAIAITNAETACMWGVQALTG